MSTKWKMSITWDAQTLMFLKNTSVEIPNLFCFVFLAIMENLYMIYNYIYNCDINNANSSFYITPTVAASGIFLTVLNIIRYYLGNTTYTLFVFEYLTL